MKIGYIGKFQRIYDEEGIARSLEKLGVEVIRFEVSEFELNYSLTLEKIQNSNLDYLMSPKWPVYNIDKIFKECQQKGIKTITWHSDAFYELEGRHNIVVNKEGMYKADYVLTPEGYAHNFCIDNKINHFIVRQGIYNECCYRGIPIYQPYDVVFIGGATGLYHTYRTDLIEFLHQTYKDKFLHIGKAEHEIRMDDLNNLIASSKIIIGESVPKPYYWSNRLYETIGRGGFCLHAYHEGIDKEYDIGTHFDVYYREEGFSKIKDKIDYWIENDEERQKVANKGMIHTQKYHTLANRASQLIEIITNNKKNKI